jgi:hypothetical protein
VGLDYQRFGTRISGNCVWEPVVADWKKGRKAPGSIGGWYGSGSVVVARRTVPAVVRAKGRENCHFFPACILSDWKMQGGSNALKNA